MRFLLCALVPLAAAGLAFAPTAAAGCNDSSGTTVCAQGDIRGTHAGPPSRSTDGVAYGAWCGGNGFCYRGSGIAISLGP
jgi:hypothetical protein